MNLDVKLSDEDIERVAQRVIQLLEMKEVTKYGRRYHDGYTYPVSPTSVPNYPWNSSPIMC